MRRLKSTLRRLGPLYRAAFWAHRFGVAALAVRLDLTPLREVLVLSRGGQDLPAGNHRFFRNVVAGLARHAEITGRRVAFVDVGANGGWFAKTILRFAPKARIIGYEPLRSQHAALDQLRTRYPNFSYRTCALGETDGELVLSERGTSGLSSFKEISNTYAYTGHFDTTVVSKYAVDVRRLDDEIPRVLEELGGREAVDLVLKIDTQGFEFEVLKGAAETLTAGLFKYVLIELMTVEKYEGGRIYIDIVDLLHSYGYLLWDINPQQYEAATYQMSEFDAVFVLDDARRQRVMPFDASRRPVTG